MLPEREGDDIDDSSMSGGAELWYGTYTNEYGVLTVEESSTSDRFNFTFSMDNGSDVITSYMDLTGDTLADDGYLRMTLFYDYIEVESLDPSMDAYAGTYYLEP